MPDNKGNLSFVVYDQPTGSGVPDTKKQVRAQAARVGWSARKQSNKPTKQSSGVSKKSKAKGITYQLEVLDVGEAPEHFRFLESPGLYDAAVNSLRPTAVSTGTSSTTSPSPANFPSTELSIPSGFRRYPDLSNSSDTDDDPLTDDVEEISRTRTPSTYFDTVLNEDYILCDHIGNGADPCWSLPVKWRPFYGTLADYWQNTISQVMQNEIQTGFQGTDKKTRVMDLLACSIETNAPALFYGFFIMIISVLPAKHPLSHRNIPFFAQWLRVKAVEMLNVAISDPKHRYDTTTIGAVNCIAFCEGINGNVDVARNVHQKAVRRMIAARGGIEELEASSPHGTYMRLATLQLDRMISSKFDQPFFFPEVRDPVIDSTNWKGAWGRIQSRLEELC